jgi:dTDP-4-dehydrorhamnose reductase
VKALVTGADGQLGRALVARLGKAVKWAGGRDRLDVTDAAAVRTLIKRVRPDVVFNAAAWNAVDLAESEPEKALAVNGSGPLHLALAARKEKARLVHVSTDYVFDGSRRQKPYEETAAPRPISAYGMSKLAGEMAVLAVSPRHIVARTSGVLGRGGSKAKGGSFVERILARARAGEPLRVVDDQEFSPTSAEDLADALVELVEEDLRGLVHVTNSGSCTWHALAVAALEEAGLDAPVERIETADLDLPARRPAFSVLANRRREEAGLAPLRPWRDALRDLLREPETAPRKARKR